MAASGNGENAPILPEPLWAESPRSAEEAAAILKRSAERGEPVYPVGGGTKASRPPAPSARGGILRTSNLAGVVEFEPGDLVVTAEAGTRLSDLQAFLRPHRQFVPVDPPEPERATLGGIVAAGECGPLRHRFPPLRFLVLGLWAALPDGSVIHTGGRVVKNVAGFDLAKLFLHSRGTLGVVTRVTLRAYALPEAERTLLGLFREAAPAARAAEALGEALTLHRLEIRAGVEGGDSPRARFAVLATIAGAGEVVETERPRGIAILRSAGAADPVLEIAAEARDGESRLALGEPASSEAGGGRAFVPPTVLREALGALPEAGIRHGCSIFLDGIPAAGFARVRVRRSGAPLSVAAALGQLRRLCEAGDGYLVADRLPAGASLDWRGREPAGAGLMRRLKAAFDPRGILAPGWGP